MQENIKGLYAAFKAKDARFDGRFFVGISSTGIYCRPVCKARQPKAENCTFFRTAAAAEQAGYRPCLLCRPELAPGTSVTDATADLVYRAARMLERNCGSGQSLREIAERLGCTDRHLRRVLRNTTFPLSNIYRPAACCLPKICLPTPIFQCWKLQWRQDLAVCAVLTIYLKNIISLCPQLCGKDRQKQKAITVRSPWLLVTALLMPGIKY